MTHSQEMKISVLHLSGFNFFFFFHFINILSQVGNCYNGLFMIMGYIIIAAKACLGNGFPSVLSAVKIGAQVSISV